MVTTLDINKLPFSRYGSFITISRVPGKEGLFLRSVRGGDFGSDRGVIFEIAPISLQGTELDYDVLMKPEELTLRTVQGIIRFCLVDQDLVAIHGEGVTLALRRKSGRYDNVVKTASQIFRVNCAGPDLRFTVASLTGEVVCNAPWQDDRSTEIELELHPGADNTFYVVMQEFVGASSTPKMIRDSLEGLLCYDTQVQNVAESYDAWRKKVLPVSDVYEKGRDIASYITWSCVVPPSGTLTRPAMYMSKNWMTNIWSWDNCFNALALAKNNPELAWDQLMIFFDLQDTSGMLPDFANDKYVYYSFTKPPIHGWTLSLLLQENPGFFGHRLGEIFPQLEKLTNYWFDYTDYSGRGMPSYNHGNDAGWDNSTIFAGGVPVAGPDLLAFLIVQMDVLALVAGRLGLEEKASYWERRANESLELLLTRYWNGKAFSVPDRSTVGDSLIAFMPLILGERLPKETIQKLVSGLQEEDRFLTPYGLATESISSEFYRADGYWRGPIWAPSTMLIVNALERCGESTLASTIAKRFVDMANSSGMSENFNATTGEGLRDPAFTWTSSVFLYLANKLFEKD